MDINRASLKLFTANVTNAIIVFITITFLSRWLGAAQIGVFFLFEALLGLLSIPSDFGIRTAVEKRLSEGKNGARVLGSALVLKLIPFGIVALSIVFLQKTINSYLGVAVANYLILALLLNEGYQLITHILKGELRVGETAILDLARRSTWAVVSGLLVHQGWGPRGPIIGLIAGLAVATLWGVLKQDTSLGTPSTDASCSLFAYSKYSVVSRFGGYVYSWMDLAIIGIFLTQTHVGAYEVAWRVTALVVLLSNSIASALFPQASEWDTEGARDQIEEAIPLMITPALFFVIPSFFATLLFSREILGILFGQEYTIAWLALIVLMAEKFLQAPHIVIGRALQAIDRPDLAAKATVTAVVTNAILNPILIVQWGLVGAAVATTISFALNMLLHAKYLSRFISIHIRMKEIGWCVLSALGMTVVLRLGINKFIVASLPDLVLIVVFGAIVYFAFVLLSPSLRGQFQNLMTETLLHK